MPASGSGNLEVLITANSRSFVQSFNEGIKLLKSDDTLKKVYEEQLKGLSQQFIREFNEINQKWTDVKTQMAEKADTSAFKGYEDQLNTLKIQMSQLADQAGQFRDVIQSVAGGKLDNDGINALTEQLQTLIGLAKPMQGITRSLMEIATASAIPSSGVTGIEKQVEAYNALSKELDMLQRKLASLDYEDYEDRLRARVSNFDTLDTEQLEDKLRSFYESYTTIFQQFEQARQQLETAEASGTATDRQRESVHFLEEEVRKAAASYQLLYSYVQQASEGGKNFSLTDGLKEFSKYSAQISSEFESDFGAKLESSINKVQSDMGDLADITKKAGIDIKSVLLNLEDGSIKIPVGLDALPDDVYAQVGKLISEVNERLRTNERRIRLKIEFDSENITQKAIKGNAEKALETAANIKDINKELSQADQALNISPDTVQSLSDVLSLADLAANVKDLAKGVNTLDPSKVSGWGDLSEQFEKLMKVLPGLKDYIGKDVIDFENFQKSLGQLAYMRKGLEWTKAAIEKKAMSPKPAEGSNLAANLKEAERVWNLMVKLRQKMDDSAAYMGAKGGFKYDLYKNQGAVMSGLDKSIASMQRQQLKELFVQYKQYGGINSVRDLFKQESGSGGVTDIFQLMNAQSKKYVESLEQAGEKARVAFQELKPIDEQSIDPWQNMLESIQRLSDALSAIKFDNMPLANFMEGIGRIGDESFSQQVQNNINIIQVAVQELSVSFAEVAKNSQEFSNALSTLDVKQFKGIIEAAKAIKATREYADRRGAFLKGDDVKMQNPRVKSEKAIEKEIREDVIKEAQERLRSRIERVQNVEKALHDLEIAEAKEINKLQEANIKKTGQTLSDEEIQPLLTKNYASERASLEAEKKRARQTLKTALGLTNTTDKTYTDFYSSVIQDIVDEFNKQKAAEEARHQGAVNQATNVFNERSQKADETARKQIQVAMDKLRTSLQKSLVQEGGESFNLSDLIEMDDESFIARFGHLSEELQARLNDIRDRAKGVSEGIRDINLDDVKAGDGADKAKTKIGNLNAEVVKLSADVKQANKDIKNFAQAEEQLPGPAKEVSQWDAVFKNISAGTTTGIKSFARMAVQFVTFGHATHGAMMMVRDSMNQGRTAVLEYDKSLTAIKYTMNMTDEQFNQLGKDTVQMARDLRMSVQDAMAISQIYANMTTTSEDILKVGRPTAILANLTGVSTEQASNQIQSVLQQFDLLEDDAMHIVDVYDKISASIKMDYAKGVNAISSAVSVAGQVAHDAGLSFEELSASVAKIVETARVEGAQAGNALKTMITRISKASKLSGADDVDNDTISKAAAALNQVGVKVYEANGSFRNLRDILTDLTEVWDSLTDAQRSNIAFEVAATRQTNMFRVMMNSFTDSMELATEAVDANGNALANQEKYMESMSGLTQGIKTEMETFWLNLYNSDAIKAGLKTALGGAETLNDIQNVLGPAGTALGAALIISIGGGIAGAAKTVIGTTLTKIFEGVGTSVAQRAGKYIGSSLSDSIANEISRTGSSSIAQALGSSLAVAGVALGAMAIYGIYAAIKKNNKQLEESRAKAQEHAIAIRDQGDAYDELRGKIEEARAVLDNAASTDAQIYQAKSDLYDIQKQLIDTYGEEAEGINLVNGNLEKQLELVNGLNQASANDWLNSVQEKGLFGRGRTGWQIAEEANQYLHGQASQFVYTGQMQNQDASEIVSGLLNRLGLMRDISGEIVSRDGNMSQKEYADAIKQLQQGVTEAITANADNEAVRDDLVAFNGDVTTGISEIVAAIEQAQAYVGMLVAGNKDAYNDVSKTGGVTYDDVEGALKEASQAYNDAVANGELTKDIEDEFERASNAAKAFAMSSEEAAEEQNKVHEQINNLMASYGKGNLDYTKRDYITNPDGSMSTIETIDEDLLGGRFSVKMASTGFTDEQIEQWFDTIEEGLQAKINRGEPISIDDILKLDKTNSILFARNGSYDENREAFEQFENDIYLLKEYGVELEHAKNRTLDTSPAEAYLRQIAENTSGTDAYKKQQALSQIQTGSDYMGALGGKGYTRADLENGNFKNIGDKLAYDYMADAFEAVGLSVDDLNDYLEETGQLLTGVEDKADKASIAMKKVFSPTDALSATDDIDKITKAVGELMTAMESSDTGKGLDVSGLKTVQDTFANTAIQDALPDWISKLNAAKDSASDTTKVLNDMLKAWIAQEGYLDQTGESYDILRRKLEEVGFSFGDLSQEQQNYLDEQWETIKAHQEQAESAEDAANAIVEDINALNNLGGQLGITESGWISYYIAKFSGAGSFSTQGDINALLALIGALDGAQAAWIDFYKARAEQLKEARTHAAKKVAGGATTSEIRQDKTIQTGMAAAADSQLKNLGFNGFSATGKGKTVENLAKYSTIGRASRAMNNEASDQGISSKDMGDLVQAALYAGEKNNQEYVHKQLEAETKNLLNMDTTGGSNISDYAPLAGTGKTSKGGGSNGSGKEKEAKEPKEIDWIQRKIDLLEKQHTIEQDIATDENKSYAERMAAYESLRQQDQFMIDVLKAGADEYKTTYEQAFDKVKKLAGEDQTLEGVIGNVDTVEELKKAIEGGEIAIDQYGEEAYEAINTAIDAWDKYQDQLDAVRQKEKEEHEHLLEELRLRVQEIQEYNSYVQAQGTNIQNELSLIEARGQVVTESVYKDLIRNSQEQIGYYEDEMAAYEDLLSELEEGSAEYNQTLASIQECANSIQQCELNQIEWNEAIKDIPIKRLEKYLAILENIKTDILNYINETDNIGAVVDADSYNELMKLSQDQIKKLLEQQKLYKDKLKDYDFGSEKYNETAEAMQEIDNSISTILQDMGDWSKAILALPIDKLSRVTEQLTISKEAIDDLLDDYNTVLSGVAFLIDKQTEAIQTQRDEYEEMMDERVQGIQDVIDALEKENEAREKQLNLEQAEYDLDRANTQKSIQVIQDGQRQFMADQEAIRAAQQELNSATFEKHIYDLQQQIEQLEKERDEKLKDYDEQLEFLDKQAEKWSTIVSNIEGARDMLVSLQYLGAGWDTKILSGKDNDIYNAFKNNYQISFNQQELYDKQIESNNRIAKLMQEYVDEFIAGNKSIDEVRKGLAALTSNINDKLTATENITETRRLFGGASFESILSTLEKQATAEANRYPEYLKMVQSNNNATEEYRKSWDELKEQVEAEKALLEKQWKELQEQKEYAKTLASTVKHDSDGGSVRTSPGTYVAVDGAGNYTKYEGGKVTESGNIRGSSMSELHDKGYSSNTIIAEGAGHYTANRYHDGIDNGAVGTNTDYEKLKALKAMALTPLKPNEIPAILKAGEVVLNGAQQSNLLSNISRIGMMGQRVAGTTVHLEMNNLTFHEIQNGQDFANFITKNLQSAVAQGLNKR